MSIVELYHVVITMAEHFPKDLAWFYDRREFLVKRVQETANPRNTNGWHEKKERGNSERRLALELDIFEGKERDRSKAFERSYLAITRIAEAHWNSSWNADHFKYSARIEMKSAPGVYSVHGRATWNFECCRSFDRNSYICNSPFRYLVAGQNSVRRIRTSDRRDLYTDCQRTLRLKSILTLVYFSLDVSWLRNYRSIELQRFYTSRSSMVARRSYV